MSNSTVFIGGGSIATALIGRALRAGWSPSEITVVEPHGAQRDALKSQFGVETIESIGDANSSADVVIWALKPQVMREVAQKIGP